MKIFYKLFGIILLVAIIGVLMAGCGEDEPPAGLDVKSVIKFEAEPSPYTGAEKIRYSYSFEGYEFYYIHLGELKNIPIYYLTPEEHTGMNWTYEFSTTTITENSIRNTVTESSQTVTEITESNTKSKTTEHNLSWELGAQYKYNGIFNKVNIEAKTSGEHNWKEFSSTENFRRNQMTTSLTNTVDHATTYTEKNKISRKFNLSSNDKSGFYRYTLFSASDVYLYVIKGINEDTKEKEIIYYEFVEHIIPDVYFWSLDYSESPSFGKSDATSFEFDISMLDNLPPAVIALDDPRLSMTVTRNHTSGGNVSVNGNINPTMSVRIPQNIPVNIAATPSSKQSSANRTVTYSFINWTVTSGTATFGNAGNAATTVTLSSDATIRANFRTEIREEFHVGEPEGRLISFNEGFPATIEIYALGAGGGGQGSHSFMENIVRVYGTGGAGGGGAAAYCKFNVTNATGTVWLRAIVARGGAGGIATPGNPPEANGWYSGFSGEDAPNTTVRWSFQNPPTNGGEFIVEGGKGGGEGRRHDNIPSGTNRILAGGRGGTPTSMPINTRPQITSANWDTCNGFPGGGGQQRGAGSGSNIGHVGNLNIGTIKPFGGNGSAYGHGGAGGNQGGPGLRGRDGFVEIVITYPPL